MTTTPVQHALTFQVATDGLRLASQRRSLEARQAEMEHREGAVAGRERALRDGGGDGGGGSGRGRHMREGGRSGSSAGASDGSERAEGGTGGTGRGGGWQGGPGGSPVGPSDGNERDGHRAGRQGGPGGSPVAPSDGSDGRALGSTGRRGGGSGVGQSPQRTPAGTVDAHAAATDTEYSTPLRSSHATATPTADFPSPSPSVSAAESRAARMALSGVQAQAERGAERLLRLQVDGKGGRDWEGTGEGRHNPQPRHPYPTQVVLSGLARASTAASSSSSSGISDALESQVRCC